MNMKKIFASVTALLVLAAVILAARSFYHQRRALSLAPLEVTANLPQGDELPIDTEGVTVMFNQAMVPLTTIDKGRDQAIDLTISPKVDGRFFWLGTRGFIFRPTGHLDPATEYTVTVPTGVESIEGNQTRKPITWQFSTVTPKVIDYTSSETLFPKEASLYIRFNLAMNTSEVENNLSLIDANTGKTVAAKHKLVWSEDNHYLEIDFQEPLPFDTDLTLTLPAGTHAKTGKIGMKTALESHYHTPAATMTLARVYIPSQDTDLDPKIEQNATVGDAVCYQFSQHIEKESFVKAFERTTNKPKLTPYYYYLGYDRYFRPSKTGKDQWVEGYDTACAAFFDDYNQSYAFTVDPNKIVSLFGSKLIMTKESYKARTGHASPQIHSNLTKNILSADGPKHIPMYGMNLNTARINIYTIADKANYNESIKDDTVDQAGIWEDQKFVPTLPAISESISGTTLTLPLTEDATRIDQERMPLYASQEIPLKTPADQPAHFSFDLSTLEGNKKLAPGFYLLEFVGMALENQLSPKARYAIVQVTPTALAIKAETDHVLVWATDIETGKPITGVPIHINASDWDNQEYTGDGTTNADGVAIINAPFGHANQFCAEATDPKLYAYSCNNLHQLDNDWRGLLRQSQNYFAYVYTDRPIYRPGQTVYISSFVRYVREGRYFTPEPTEKYSIEVTDAAGNVIYDASDLTDPSGVISAEFTLENKNDIPRGNYSVTVSAGEQRFTRTFVVSSYRKPTFKVDASAVKKEITSNEELTVDVTGSYFFGAPLKKAKTNWSIMTSTYVFRPEGFEDYSYIDDDLLLKKTNSDYEGECYDCSDYYAPTDDDVIKTSESDDQYDDPRGSGASRGASDFFKDPQNHEVAQSPTLDENGKLQISYKPDLKNYPFSQVLTVEANITDSANQEVSSSEDVVVHKASYYLGVKSELWTYGEHDTAKIQVVSLDTNGKPQGNHKFTAQLVRRDYEFIERRNAKGWWDYIFEPKDTAITESSAKTGSDGKTTVEFKIPESGEYRVVLKATDDKKNLIQSATTFWAWGEGYAPWRMEGSQKLELVADKDSYKIGDTAHILIKSLVPTTKAVLTLERGRILEYKLIDLGGTNAAHIDLPITEGMIPNLYVNVLAQTGRNQNQPPLVFNGSTELHVEPESKRLQISLSTDHIGSGTDLPKYAPGEKVTVNVTTKDATGKPTKAHVIVSVADESVLRLLDYQLPDLVKKFYYLRPNSVLGSSSLVSLKAGDGSGDKSKKRRIFKDTAHFEANLVTNEKGEGSFTFTLPDDLTTWVIEALGVTESKSLNQFDSERVAAATQTPLGQMSLGSNLNLSDGTFVGGNRAKFLSTLPVLIRPALPRFTAWGDHVMGSIIANNQNPTPVKGKIFVTIGGDAGENNQVKMLEIPYSVAAQSEETYPLEFTAADNIDRVTVAAEAKDESGKSYDGFEVSINALDRYQPEVVATSGVTRDTAHEKIDIPKDLITTKGGLTTRFKASLGVAMAGPMRDLIYYPYGCSEQKSSSILAMLMAHDLSNRMGETYFDSLAPLSRKELEGLKNFDDKKTYLDSKIIEGLNDLTKRYQSWGGGIKYWPEDLQPNPFPSIQVTWAFALARELGFNVDETSFKNLRNYVANQLLLSDEVIPVDEKAFGLWALSQAQDWNNSVADDLIRRYDTLSVTGLSYLTMALRTHGAAPGTIDPIAKRIASLSQQEARFTQWRESAFFWSSKIKNTALAANALYTANANDPLVPRALIYLLTRKKVGVYGITQDNLALSYFAYRYAINQHEDATNYKASVTVGGKELTQAKFDLTNLLSESVSQTPLSAIAGSSTPADINVAKNGDGTLYYDLEFKYYLNPDIAPPREEGLIVARQFYALDDKNEEHPLTEFKAGENYKGHIVLVVPKDANYIFIEDQLPAGFEPLDMTLATTSRAAQVRAERSPDSPDEEGNFTWNYDDVIRTNDYGMSYAFSHQEIHDDAIIWSDSYLPAGVYHIRYPVRATTKGKFLMSGTTASEFYNPEIFGRSRSRMIEIQ